MFAPRYFADRYFPRRYFPVGGEDTPPEPVVTGVAVPPTSTVYAGRSRSILAVVTGTNVTQRVLWSIESGDGTLIDDEANPVLFKAPSTPGTTTIRATSVDDPDHYDECVITVAEAPPVTGIDGGLIRNPIRGPVRGTVS